MRNRQLHAALAAFVEEAAWQLSSDTAEGHEIGFEVVEARGARRDTPLYCYRPLTGDFIAERRSILARLPTYLAAVRALAGADGLDAYLEAHLATGGAGGLPARERSELALRTFLTRVFEDCTDFAFSPERLERAYAELEAVVTAGRTETIVVVPVLGLAIEADEIALGEGLVLVRGDVLDDAPPEASSVPDAADEPLTLAMLRSELAADGAAAPLREAATRFGRLIAALGLFDPAGACLGPTAWTRSAGGPWRVAALGTESGRPRDTCLIEDGQEDELRAFCSLVTRRTPRAGELAWALRRFSLACGRARAADALTDHLLALRALLEPEGPESGRLAGRLAAVCAEPAARAGLAARVTHAIAAEHAVITGVGLPAPGALDELAGELEDHLRAILRDVLCGHLDADVRGVADTLIARDAEQPTAA